MASYSNTKQIDKKIKGLLYDHFREVYVSDEYEEKGYESIRIVCVGSTNMEYVSTMLEIRSYEYEIYYYTKKNAKNVGRIARNRVDRIVHLLSCAIEDNTWIDMIVDKVEYNTDPDDEDLHISKIELKITKDNQLVDLPVTGS